MQKIDARSKFFLMLVFSLGICFVHTLAGLGVYALLLLVVALLLFAIDLGKSIPRFAGLITATLKVSIPVYILALFSFLSNALLWTNGGFIFIEEGIFRGLFFSLRLILLVWFSLLIANTISFQEFSNLFDWILKPLKFLRIPTKELSLTATIALRFIPETYFEFEAIKNASWARGACFNTGSVLKRTKAYASCMIPLLIKMIQKSQELSDALTVRCWGLVDVDKPSFEGVRGTECFFLFASSVVLIATSYFL